MYIELSHSSIYIISIYSIYPTYVLIYQSQPQQCNFYLIEGEGIYIYLLCSLIYTWTILCLSHPTYLVVFYNFCCGPKEQLVDQWLPSIRESITEHFPCFFGRYLFRYCHLKHDLYDFYWSTISVSVAVHILIFDFHWLSIVKDFPINS